MKADEFETAVQQVMDRLPDWVHEIAHYFGIDDDHLDEIGWG